MHGHSSYNVIVLVSDKGFAAMFRPLYKKNPQKMETIHKKFAEELQKTIQVKNTNILQFQVSDWTWLFVSAFIKEDISRLTEEGMLEFKLDELDKLEDATKNDLNPAWSVNRIKPQFVLHNTSTFYYLLYYGLLPHYLSQNIHICQVLLFSFLDFWIWFLN